MHQQNKDTEIVEYLLLLISSKCYNFCPPCAQSCRGPRTQLPTSTLGLYALSCRASTYATTQDLDFLPQSYDLPFLVSL